jgi:hypothetical protein
MAGSIGFKLAKLCLEQFMTLRQIFSVSNSSNPMLRTSMKLALMAWLCCLSTNAWSDGQNYISLIAGKNASLQLCMLPGIEKTACSELLAMLTSSAPPEPIAPELRVAGSDDDRLRDYGAGCPPTGADIRGDPYQSFEHEYNGERGMPAGPFEVFDVSRFYPGWKGYSIIKVQGYGPENFGHPSPAFGWTDFYIVQNARPCPVVWFAGEAAGGFSQPPSINYSNDIVYVDGKVILIQLHELAEDTEHYYGTVFLLANQPSMQPTSKNLNSTLLLSFAAE